jgi:hypothetical protein
MLIAKAEPMDEQEKHHSRDHDAPAAEEPYAMTQSPYRIALIMVVVQIAGTAGLALIIISAGSLGILLCAIVITIVLLITPVRIVIAILDDRSRERRGIISSKSSSDNLRFHAIIELTLLIVLFGLGAIGWGLSKIHVWFVEHIGIIVAMELLILGIIAYVQRRSLGRIFNELWNSIP